ncbi:SAM-dependent methyltransferase [Acanthopleuribacter pedis]|uniref:Methyltransferase domain-containing protein n=1 Tax=Acanthopleuribacter pedis TaxID=442870 RepID=A0A8J7QNC5_9BACT|nr:methyltransferase domain-containing protein [Acanthopleuribacter pedis]MBO1322355.1 methyltransferase domain-containing protein [Acanthopleuribacter pedis]
MSVSCLSPAAKPPAPPVSSDPYFESSGPGPIIQSGGSKQHIQQYYEASGLDYRYWSPGFNMHFGYYERGANPFQLENMLATMNRRVLKLLGLNSGRVLDCGCGAGATANQLAREHQALHITGVSLVAEQITRAQIASQRVPQAQRPRFVNADFTDLPFDDASFEGAWNLESACHAPGPGKEALVKEVYRVLKPGASWVVVDGFLKRRPKWRLPRWILGKVHDYWALETFAERDAFVAALEAAGFEAIEVIDWSWRVAPSALHIPRVTAHFFASEYHKNKAKKLGHHRLANALAPMFGLALGLTRSVFGYYAVRAKKPS